jgi:hypothetical protein
LNSPAVDGPKSLAKKMVRAPSITVFSFGPAFGTGGHDIAFDGRNAKLHFFDPNFGYFFAENPNEDALIAFLRDTWAEFSYSVRGRVTKHYRKVYAS